MHVILIGAGRLATNLGKALLEAGHDILQVYSRTMESASALATLAGGAPVTEIEKVRKDADVYIISVKDSVLPDLVQALCSGRSTKVFLHTAGSVNMDVFAGMALHYGVFYPMQSFSNMTTTSLNREKEAAVKREKELAKLNEYNKQINDLQIEKEKEKMRSNLLRAISHDLRTPLTGMIGASSTYLEAKDQLDEEAKDQLVMGIKEDANWLLNMVENLLSITRIQSNGSDTQPHVKKVPEPLEEVVSEAIQRYHKRYPDSELKVKIPEDFLMVPMDPTLIEQVIMNLLENAWVHAGTRGPIELDIKEEEKNVVFYVRDHGVGIEPERIDQIFDGCAGAIDHESRKGMGIGLSICKSIVMAHQGDVYARNYEDGAEFSFSLPMDEEELTEEEKL